ncbi:transmembrane protein 114 isoform X2 [Carassius auratus]|uniref:Transmembrane protein 114 isoform X2 n=1 Tax=Carassius auratus TaxID=7957 RepID=A0A6P6JBW3_CARAU|nr:transmembrane protein 114-like isoform X2 [Carassius auratus]XP_052401526.1 transmembrane protein 114-like isoform X2 [Carassius gibelio]
MKITFTGLASFVATFGVLSFVGLVLAIGTDFWYIIDTSKRENSSSESLSSHSGLWRTCNYMQGTFIVLLPLSVIVLFIGGMLGFISMLARAYLLLLLTGVLLLFGAMLSLAGICVYMAYSAAAFKEAVDISGHKTLEDIEIYFGWSLILASVSFVGELFTAVGFLLTSARVSQLTNQEEHEY